MKPVNGNYQEYSYSRYEYPTSQIHSKVYSTITDTNSNEVGDSADEVLSESYSDGAGRTLKSRSENPNSTGGFSGGFVEYNILGQVKRSTTPTELNGSWTPAGDDAGGFLWTSQEYDWKGRTTKQINTDGTYQLISYTGCGCAGGQETTVKSENNRTQKSYSDILGRTYKSESLDWNNEVYSTLVNTYNGRDQVTNSRQYAGDTDPSNEYQDSTMTYDGFGRLKTRHYPIENGNTTWAYNIDGSLQSVTDPRGASTNYGYDSRGLTTNISYAVPQGSTVVVPTPVNFSYDDLGNRLSMSDNSGTVSYVYNSLSQMTSETRTFAGLTGNYTLSYDYQLSGDVKSITDPFNATVSYKNDKIGRLEKVEGSGFMNIATYAENVRYRAFGGIKQMNYKTDDNALMTVDYDNRQRIDNYKVASSVVSGGYVQNYDYEYYADSKLKKVDNQVSGLHEGFDRDFDYDHQGRLTFNFFDEVPVPNSAPTSPFNQGIEYDAFSNMTRRYNYIWGFNNINEFDATYTNNRQDATNEEALTYDDSGRVTKVDYRPNQNPSTKYMTSKFDARGIYIESLNREITGGGGSTYIDKQFTVAQTFDTDGQRTKRVETDYVYSSLQGTTNDVKTDYYVNSTVTGKTITELYDNGTKKTTNVYFGSAVMATQTINSVGTLISWNHSDPLTGSSISTRQDGYAGENKDFEPLGGLLSRQAPPGGETGFWKLWSEGGNAADPGYGCVIPDTGVPAPCNLVSSYLRLNDGIGISATELRNRGKMLNPESYSFIGADNNSYEHQVSIADYRPIDSNRKSLINSVAAQVTEDEPLPSNEKLKKAITNLQDLNEGDCRDFLNAVLANMDIKKKINGKKVQIDTVEKLFDYITDTKKIGFVAVDLEPVKIYVGQKPERSAGRSHVGKGDIGVERVPKASNEATKYQYQMKRALTIIHEMLHRAGQSHDDMQEAGLKALSEKERKEFEKSGDSSNDYSRMVHDKCKFDPYNSDERVANLVQ